MAACGMRCTMRGRSSGTPTPEVGSQVVVSEEGRAAVSESNGIPSYTASNLLTHLLTYLLTNELATTRVLTYLHAYVLTHLRSS